MGLRLLLTSTLFVSSFVALAGAQDASWASRLSGPRLQRQLSSAADPNQRAAAARELAVSGDPSRSVVALSEALARERTSVVRAAIARALAMRGDASAVPALSEAFNASSDADSRPLAEALGALGTPDAIGVLSAALDRADLLAAAREGLRRAGAAAVPFLLRRLRESGSLAAADLLGEHGDPSAVPRLVVAAGSDSVNLRRAALRALGKIGDERALVRVRAALADADPGVRDAAAEALVPLATAADADRLAELLGTSRSPSLLLGALLRVAPERGTEAIVQRITSSDPADVRIAADFALAVPHPALVSVVYGIFEERTRRAEAAGALAELEGGAGVPVLLREAAEDDDARRALAVALRRWPSIAADRRREALAILRNHPPTGGAAMRGWTLRALARDASVRGLLETRLQDDDPHTRAWAAQALSLLGQADTELVERALAVETENEPFRRLVDLALVVGADAPEVRAIQWVERAPTAALRLLGAVGESRASRRAIRHGLRHTDPAARVAAAFALARSHDVQAWRALIERVDGDDSPEVRRAAGVALAALIPFAQDEQAAELRSALQGRAAVEADSVLRDTLLSEGPPVRGSRILRFRIAASGAPDGVLVDVLLPSGEWLRMRTLPTGEVFVPDQPAGVADVRVRVEG